MSTTDTRAAFEAHIQKECRTDYESYLVVQRFDRKPEEYQLEKVQSRWKTWQAATEAAKATGTAGELPPLPDFPAHARLYTTGLGRRTYRRAATTPGEGAPLVLVSEAKAIAREYGQACAEAALAKVYAIAVEEKAKMAAEAARQPAPVAAVKLMTMQEVIDAMHGNNLLTDIGYSALLNGDYIEATLEYITQVINYAAIPAIAATNRSQP